MRNSIIYEQGSVIKQNEPCTRDKSKVWHDLFSSRIKGQLNLEKKKFPLSIRNFYKPKQDKRISQWRHNFCPSVRCFTTILIPMLIREQIKKSVTYQKAEHRPESTPRPAEEAAKCCSKLVQSCHLSPIPDRQNPRRTHHTRYQVCFP